MTKDEAIEVLIANYPSSYYGELREAVDEAIESLETDVSDTHNTLNTLDLISRGKLFNLLAPVQTLAEAYAVIQNMNPEIISGMCYIQEALDVLEIYKRNMIHILGDHDEKVKVIETCQMLISELEENKDN